MLVDADIVDKGGCRAWKLQSVGHGLDRSENIVFRCIDSPQHLGAFHPSFSLVLLNNVAAWRLPPGGVNPVSCGTRVMPAGTKTIRTQH